MQADQDRTSLLEQTRAHFAVNGWPADDLDRFRMEDPPAGDPPADPPAGDPPADPPLGYTGKAALDAERTARSTAERALKPWDKIAKDSGMTAAEVAALVAAYKKKDPPKGDEPPDADAIRAAAEKDATARANTRIVRAEVKALAADMFADPADAHLYLTLDDFDVDDDGNEAAVKKALADVLTKKPHLKKTRGPRSDNSQGGGGGGETASTTAKPGQDRMRAAYAESSAK